MRMFLAILVCKLLRFIGKLVGKGSSLPGEYALKICPDVLRRVKLPEHIIAVTGSNGKTSTVEMIAAILRAGGKTVVYNEEGSNQIEGVTTLILCNSTLGGRMKADVLLLESDERYARRSFQWFHPTHFVITNLYRDQLTRNGHPEWVYDAILPAVHPDTTLVLNADDPLVSCFARDHDPAKVKWFGLDRCPVSTREHRGVYHDGARCPVCRGRMEYACYHYAHIGHYSCPQCGHARHAAVEDEQEQGIEDQVHPVGQQGRRQRRPGVPEGPQVVGEDGDQRVEEEEAPHDPQIGLGVVHEQRRRAYDLQDVPGEGEEKQREQRPRREAENQSQLSGLIGHPRLFCADVLRHDGGHTRGHDVEHDDKEGSVSVGRADGPYGGVAHGGEHDGVHHARQHGAEGLQQNGDIQLREGARGYLGAHASRPPPASASTATS